MTRGVILDTDIGYDPDDLFALLLLLNSPEIKLDLIVTGDEVQGKRAIFTKKILDMLGSKVKIVQGADIGNEDFVVDELIKDVCYDIETDYLTAVRDVMAKYDEVIYINIQGFTNLAKILHKFPQAREKLIVYQMGGAVDYTRREGWIEHNIKIDIEAAQHVLNQDINISLVMAQTTFNNHLEITDQHPFFKKLKESSNKVHQLLARHCEIWYQVKGFYTYMHDPLTVSVALGKQFVEFNESPIQISDDGVITTAEIGPDYKLSKKEAQHEKFMQFLEKRLFQK